MSDLIELKNGIHATETEQINSMEIQIYFFRLKSLDLTTKKSLLVFIYFGGII